MKCKCYCGKSIWLGYILGSEVRVTGILIPDPLLTSNMVWRDLLKHFVLNYKMYILISNSECSAEFTVFC